MLAITITDQSEPIQLAEKPIPTPNKDQALIKLKASALNRRDQWIRQGMYPGIQFGTTLGSDGAGIVEAVGDDANKGLIGKEVMINPNMNWGEDPAVQSSDYHIAGMPTDGTLAEYIVVDVNQLVAKPSYLSWEEAAALPLGGLTAYRACFHHGQIKFGKNVLISGVGGGVAQFAFQFALAVGANVYVTSGSEDKREKCLQMGAKGAFDYKSETWFKEALKETGGFDTVIDSAGGDQVNTFIKIMKPAGTIVFYGATNGTPKNLDMFRMFWNQITLQGSTMGNDIEFCEMVSFVDQHQIKPIVDSLFDLKDAHEAFDKIKNGVFGKVVMKNS